MLGASTTPSAKGFVAPSRSNGYTEVRLCLSTSRAASHKRPIGTGNTNVKVVSTDRGIESGTTKIDTLRITVIRFNSFAAHRLRDPRSMTRFKTKAFTWRTLRDYADEDRIAGKSSVLLPAQTTSVRRLSAHWHLVTGRDYAAWARNRSADTKEIQTQCFVIEYLEQQPRKRLRRVSSRLRKLWAPAVEARSSIASTEISHRMEQVPATHC